MPCHRGIVTAALVLVPMLLEAQQRGPVTGTVHTADGPLAAALVYALAGSDTTARAATDAAGRFTLSLAPGGYTLLVRAAGYRTLETPLRVPTDAAVTLTLEPDPFLLEQLTVTPLRRHEKALDAPVSVSVVDRERVRQRTAITGLDYTLGLPGVDVAMQGLQGRQVVARGFNQTFGTSLLMMTDYRTASVPSLRANLSHYITPIPEDIDRVEVLRGPASALYGPNAADGVVHFITATPFQSQGTEASVTMGGRAYLNGSVRHADLLGERAAVRVSARYLRGDEWEAPGPALAPELTARDPRIERTSGSARLDVRVRDDGMAVLGLGSTLAMRHVEYTGIGASQVHDWRYDFAQLRYSEGRLFAQLYVNTSDAGETFNLRTLDPVVDGSRLWVAQLQHGRELGSSTLTYGLDYQRTDPRTGGSISGRNEGDDISNEIGGYAQAELRVSPRWQLVLAGRADRHDRMNDLVFSPRLATLFSPAEGHRVRASWSRAFATPTATDLFLDLLAARLDPLPFGMRAIGVPKDGFRFGSGCGGPCMLSGFAPGPRIPLDATRLWPAVVEVMRASGVDLSGIPAPTAADVGTVLRILDPASQAFVAFDGTPRDIAPLEPTVTSAFELGYRGQLAGKLLVDLSAYRSRRENFRGPLGVETPNAFLATADLAAYLGRFMPAEQAGALAAGIGGSAGDPSLSGLPLATVVPDHELATPDILLTYRNFGDVSLWGIDLAARLWVGDATLGGAYSFVSDNYFPAEHPGEPDLSLNGPRHKLAMSAGWAFDTRAATAELRARHVGGFRMVDGVWIGEVPAFTTLDAEAGVALPGIDGARLIVTAQNLTDERHSEFVGAPVLGRLLLTRLTYRF